MVCSSGSKLDPRMNQASGELPLYHCLHAFCDFVVSSVHELEIHIQKLHTQQSLVQQIHVHQHSPGRVLTGAQVITQGQRFPCPAGRCDKTFTRKADADRHLRKYGPPKYHCSGCGRGFYRRDKMADHQKAVHTK